MVASKGENTSTIEKKLAKVEINNSSENKFSHDLETKLSEIFNDCIISCIIREKTMIFSFETFIMRSEMAAQELIKAIDEHITEYLFSTNGLAELGWCSKYLVESTIFVNKNACDLDKFKKTQLIEFYWFKFIKSNYPNQKVCSCFHCLCCQKN